MIAGSVQAIVAIGLAVFTGYMHNIYTLLAYVIILHTTIGFIFNNVLSYLLTRFTNNGGKASGLAGGGYIIFTSAFSYTVVSAFSIKSQAWLGLSYSVLSVAVLIIFACTKWLGEPITAKKLAREEPIPLPIID